MEAHEGGWIFDGSAASRLWEKSAIGLMVGDGRLVLNDAELIFCINHRGIDSPGDRWIAGRADANPSLLHESAVLEALRVPGNKVVMQKNLDALGIPHSNSWAARWPSNKHPKNDEPVAEIIWYFSKDSLAIRNNSEFLSEWDGRGELESLLQWSVSVSEKGRIAEILVIDDEQSVVTYRVEETDPIGKLAPPSRSDFERISAMHRNPMSGGGSFVSSIDGWPSEAIGIPLHNGRKLDSIEENIVRSGNGGEAESRISVSSSILLDLWNRGLNTRSGFKYGTTWRCYEGDVGEGHAPWLIVDPFSEGPENWAEACLSSRLASGVNKHWLYPIHFNGRWRYLEISRPPSDSRWSNPHRH